MRKRTKASAGVAAFAAAALALGLTAPPAIAGPVGLNSGFEDDDGNLVDDSGSGINAGIDWNNFNTSPGSRTWTGSAPTRVADGAAGGWVFKGIEDWQATTSDSAFAGGTKQDDNCPTVGTGKAPNKDDLKRVYLSSKTVPVDEDPGAGVDIKDHVFLNLAWVRIPQNTTSPSAHIGFEFNKGTGGACASGGLVSRVAGDMLIVYDFEGSATDNPTLTLRRWVSSGSCEISSNSPPCWGVAQNLTLDGDAEGRVNTGSTALDVVAPSNETLGINEFGEAGIDLTDAGVFAANTCESFGKAYAVSRSSGNSGTAQMKDLAGPVDFQLQNCGTVKIIKQTNPRGLNQNFAFTSNLAGGQLSCSRSTPTSFTLNDTGNAGKTLGSTAVADNSAGNTQTCTNVPAGSYTVTEGADPAGFAFGSLTCTASAGSSGAQDGTVPKQANISLIGGGTVTCVYVNNQQLGAIRIQKNSSKSGNGLAGATFSITKGGTAISGSPFTTASGGSICVGNLVFGDYVVTETAAPTGYAIDDAAGRTVTVDNNASCSDATYVGESTTFTDTPLADIQVRFRDGGSGETALDEAMTCTNATGTSSTADTTGWDDTLTVTGIQVTSSVVTVVCTIKIDP